jgi:hypothetical protein
MNGMQLLLAEARRILAAKKELFDLHPWSEAQNRTGGSTPLFFRARVGLDGGAFRGLWFRAEKILGSPDTGTFQLDMEQPGEKSHLPLYRLEWRPFRDHLNGPFGPEELRGVRIKEGVTHEHICLLHADEKGEFIRSGGVQTAQIVTPDPGSFQEALTYACATLSIVNQDDIPPAVEQERMV